MKLITYLLIALSTCCTISAQLLLKSVVSSKHAQAMMSESLYRFGFAVAMTPSTWLAVSIQAIGYGVWLIVLSREKMAVAIAVSGSLFYLSVSFMALLFFSEKLSAIQWCGLTLISIGVLMVASKH
ncbi:hypothetical protein AO715_06510 [Xanthomonas sp. Mitacek01]|nr:hypothetical protein AO715_06510 [Xanthomonas sp. Mitacek01]